MLSLYCSSCGSKNSYSTKKPNFCNECSKPFGAALAHTSAKPNKRKQEIHSDYEEDEDSADINLPNLDQIKINLEIPGHGTGQYREGESRAEARVRLGNQIGVKLDSIAGIEFGKPIVPIRNIDKNANPKDILAKLRQESISSRVSVEVQE